MLESLSKSIKISAGGFVIVADNEKSSYDQIACLVFLFFLPIYLALDLFLIVQVFSAMNIMKTHSVSQNSVAITLPTASVASSSVTW